LSTSRRAPARTVILLTVIKKDLPDLAQGTLLLREGVAELVDPGIRHAWILAHPRTRGSILFSLEDDHSPSPGMTQWKVYFAVCGRCGWFVVCSVVLTMVPCAEALSRK